MLKSRIVALLLVLVLAIPVFGVQAQDEPTIAEVATEAGNFTTLLAAAEAAGLVPLLSDPAAGPFTIFAPTDEAFAAVPEWVIAYLLANPEILTRVLTYHVVGGEVRAADLAGMADEAGMATAESMEMTAVDAPMMGSSLTFNVGEDGTVMVNQANVVTADIEASNGVVHVIDSVLIPSLADLLPAVDPLAVEGDITVAGSSTVLPLSTAVANQFVADGYAANIVVDGGGTGGGFERFCGSADAQPDIDIADASRPINEEEAANCVTNGREPIGFRVGTDALAIVVSSENDFLQDVTLEQVAAIFGTAETWADVDPSFPAEPIQRFIPGTDSGTFDYFVEEVYDEDTTSILAASNLQQSEDDNVLVTGVEGSPYAVGFFGYAYYEENQDLLRAVSIDGVQPSGAAVEAGTYALARPLFIYSSPSVVAEKPQVAQFINYYLQNVGGLITEVGYFPSSDYAQNLSVLLLLAADPASMAAM